MSDDGIEPNGSPSPKSNRLVGWARKFNPEMLNRPIILAVVVALAAGFGGGYLFGHVGSAGGTAVASSDGFAWPLFGKIRSANARRAGDAKPAGFAVWRQRVDTSGPDPKACIEMSKPLDGRVAYGDYVMISPEPTGAPAVSVAGSELCVAGLGFADRRITLLKGLPGEGNQVLAANADVDFVFGDQPPYVGFAGDGVILPRGESDGVGIETVNVARLAIEVWRVPDRNLVRMSILKTEPAAEGDYVGDWGDDYPGGEGEKIWSGNVPVTGKDGERATTVFPLGAVLKEMKPGGYIVVAKDATAGRDQTNDENEYGPSPSAMSRRWVIFTDMALTSYSGSSGVDAVVRSLATAKAAGGIKVALVAANGETLAEAQTDTSGRVHFDTPLLKGEAGMRAKMLMAYGAQGDLAVLDLERSPIDLSAQSIGGRTETGESLLGGRQAATAVDGYIYADRGIYRPGETAHLVALIRDRMASAAPDRKGELVLYRPSGVEFARYRFDKAEGGYVARDVALPKSSPRGRWRAALELDGVEGESGSASFTVEDFAPQRLAVDVAAAADRAMTGGEARPIGVTARFLYGAPGAGLQTQGEARLAADPNPFPQFEGYRFGNDLEPYQETALETVSTVTDGAGNAIINLPITAAGDTAIPLKATVTASVFEPGGRPVRESATLKVRPKSVYLGVKITQTETRNSDTPTAFDIIAVDANGRRVAVPNASWTLITENWDYNWFQQNGRWEWRRTSRDVVAARGQGAISAAQGLGQRRNLNWGDYRLEVEGPDGAKTVIKFSSGWGAPTEGGESPDAVRLSIGDKEYGQGDTIDLNIKAPYAGEAQIAIANDRVIEVRTVSIGANGATVKLRTSPEWGGGAYAMVTVIQPRDPSRAPIPRRAMGVTYISLDPKARKLGVEIGTPDKLGSRDEISVPVRVIGAGAGQRARVTIAAVDEGILRLTGFTSPDPVAWYFGKRALGVDYRDDYGRLLNANLGAAANVNFGGDEIGGEGLTATPIKTVALWSGVVETGLDGRAVVKLPAAEFNGELRLMAVAWTDKAVGSGAKAMTVRESVVADLNLPRFLAPGDHARATLELHNLEGKAGNYTADVKASGGVMASVRRLVTLVLGQRTTEAIDIAGPMRAGIGQVQMSVAGPDFSTTKTYPLQTRLGWGVQTRTLVESQAAGATYTPPNSLLTGLLPGGVTMYVSYSPFRGFDPAAVAMSLGAYQYGCTEQIVSTAYPLLYGDKILVDGAPRSSPGLDNAVQQLLGRQSVDGAFGLWRVGDGLADPWLGAYVTDFLIEAKARGADVPQAAIDRALSAMRQVSRPDGYVSIAYRMSYDSGWMGSDRASEEATKRMRSRASAYALYVMAKGGRGDLARLRWWHDTQMREDSSPIARAQVAAGLAMMGDRSRARSAIRAAVQSLGYREESDWYQSPLRDLSAVITYAYEAGEPELGRTLQGRLEGAVRDPDSLNTQEQARLLQAAATMMKAAGPMNVAATGAIDIADIAGQPRWGVGLLSAARFTNNGAAPLWRTVTIRGTPLVSPEAQAQGLGLGKTLFTLEGGAANPASMTQGDRMIVRITGQSRQGRTMLAVIDDALPAGWEIEAVLTGADAQDGPYRFLGELSTVNVQESRDDRYVAALDVAGNGSFAVAYVVRAVTPGDFYLPGAQAQDMYRPQVNARTAGGRAVIAAR